MYKSLNTFQSIRYQFDNLTIFRRYTKRERDTIVTETRIIVFMTKQDSCYTIICRKRTIKYPWKNFSRRNGRNIILSLISPGDFYTVWS